MSDVLLRAHDRYERVVSTVSGPLGEVDQYNLRPGLQRWVAVPTRPGGPYEAWAGFRFSTVLCDAGLLASSGAQMTADTAVRRHAPVLEGPGGRRG